MKRPPTESLLAWTGLMASLAVFAAAPGLDLQVSAHFFKAGQGFVHMHDPLVLASYVWTPVVGRTILAALALFALFSPLLARLLADPVRAQHCRGPWRRMAAIAVLCGVLGPGLLVETWFKNHIGRPRPVQVTAFGGDRPFQGVFQIGADPAHHRSFVSSHAAAGFWLLSLGLCCGVRWRRRWMLIGVAMGSLIGLGRMMQGGHFLSDIVFAFYAVWLPCQIVVALGLHNLKPLARPHLG